MRLLRFALSVTLAQSAAVAPLGLPPRAALAAATAEAQAREMFRRAEVHFTLREFDRALELYTEAYRLKPLPGFLFNIAQCHRFSGRYADAAFSYRVYLQKAPEAQNRAEVEELVREMEAKAAAARVDPPADEKMPAPAAPPAVPSAEAAPSSPDTDAPHVPAAPDRLDAPWIWAAGGLGAALIVTGAVAGQMASSRSDEYNDPSTPVSERRDLRASGRTLATVSVLTLSAGVLALGAAATLWFLGQPPAAQEARLSLVGAPGPGGGWVGLRGRF